MSGGGSRCGAGRPAWHAKTGQARRIDVRQLHRDGYLSVDHRMTWQWSGGATVALSTSPSVVTLNYRYKDRAGEWRHVDEAIIVTRTPCHYGKDRPWFLCPRCGALVAILYLWNVPTCRKCAKLVYPSQSEDPIQRTWRRTRKIEATLAGGEDRPHGKPAGMRWATFNRLQVELTAIEAKRDAELCLFVARRFPNILR